MRKTKRARQGLIRTDSGINGAELPLYLKIARESSRVGRVGKMLRSGVASMKRTISRSAIR
jgi:hypothetical protein